ncbi:hypothetical protein VaNZ11_013085 [Volvox africanus]|uniref:Uncharacterized protein n=1 Tax=Volvox africanus TaxID=51714 RepID=A0ABQ5SFA5_9CHLO|nr:hypothetical protein VaNZ11_013085 [Volvox africanus]
MGDVLQSSQTSSDGSDNDGDVTNIAKANLSLLEVLRKSPVTPSAGNVRELVPTSRIPLPIKLNQHIESSHKHFVGHQSQFQSVAAPLLPGSRPSGVHSANPSLASAPDCLGRASGTLPSNHGAQNSAGTRQGPPSPSANECSTSSDGGDSDDGIPHFNILRSRSMHPALQATCRRHSVGNSTGPRSRDLARPAVNSSVRNPLKELNPFPAPDMSPAAAAAAVGSALATGGFTTRIGCKDGDGKISARAAASLSAAEPDVMVAPDVHEAAAAIVQQNPHAACSGGQAHLHGILSGSQGGQGGSCTSGSCSSDLDGSEEDEGEETVAVPLFNLLRRAPARVQAAAPPPPSGHAGGSTIPPVARAVGTASAGLPVSSGAEAAGSCPGVARLAATMLCASPQEFASRRRCELHHGRGGVAAALPVSPARHMAGGESPPQLQQSRKFGGVCHASHAVSDAATTGAKQLRLTPLATMPAPGADCGVIASAGTALATLPGSATRVPTAGRLRLGRSGGRVPSSPLPVATTPVTAAGAAAVPGTTNSGPGKLTDEMLARAIQTAQRRRRSAPAPLRSLFEEEEEERRQRPGRDCIAQDQNANALPSPREAAAGIGSPRGGGGGSGGSGCLLTNEGAHVDTEDLTAEAPPGQRRRITHRPRPTEELITIRTEANSDVEKDAAVWDLSPVDEPPNDAFLWDDHGAPGQGWEEAQECGWMQGSAMAPGCGQQRWEQEQKQQQQGGGQPLGHQQHQHQQGSSRYSTPAAAAAPPPLPHKSPPPESNRRQRQRGLSPLLPPQQPQSLPQQLQQQRPEATSEQQQLSERQGGLEPPLPLQPQQQQQPTLAGSGRHGQAAGPATKRRATAATKAATGTQNIMSFLLRQQQAGPASAATSPVDVASQKRPRLRLSAPDLGPSAAGALPTAASAVAVAGANTLKPVTIDLVDGDVSQPRRRIIHRSEVRRPTGPAPVIVVLDDDEGTTGAASAEMGGLNEAAGVKDPEAARLEDEDELPATGNAWRVRKHKRRHAVLLLDDEEEEVEEVEEYGGAGAVTAAARTTEPPRSLQGGLHPEAAGTCANNAPHVQPAASVGAMSGGRPHGYSLLRVPRRYEEEGDEDDVIEDCSQDHEEMLGLCSARNDARGNGHGGGGGGGSGFGTAMATGRPAVGRQSLGELVGGAGGGYGSSEAARRLSLPAGGHPLRGLSGHQLPGAAPQAHGGPGGSAAVSMGMALGMGQIIRGNAAELPRLQNGLPLQPSVGAAVGQSVPQHLQHMHQHHQHHHQPPSPPQQQQQQTYQSLQRSSSYQQEQDRQHHQQQQQQAAPWWTLLPDFVPAAALADGFDPRFKQRPEPVFVLYQKQFNGPANSSVAPMHRNTWQHAPPGSGPGPSGNGTAFGGSGGGGGVGSTGGAHGAGPSIGVGTDNEVMDWARYLRSGKSRCGGGACSMRKVAAAGPAGGAAADTDGTSGGGRWYTNNYGVRVSSRRDEWIVCIGKCIGCMGGGVVIGEWVNEGILRQQFHHFGWESSTTVNGYRESMENAGNIAPLLSDRVLTASCTVERMLHELNITSTKFGVVRVVLKSPQRSANAQELGMGALSC